MTGLLVAAAIAGAGLLTFAGSFLINAVLGERRQARRDRGWR